MHYRRTNDCVTKNLHKNIFGSFSVLTKQRVRKYARRARSYRRSYKHIAEENTEKYDRCGSFLAVEKFVKECKIHRCILNQKTSYLRASIGE